MLAELLASLAIARFHRIPKEKRRTLTLDNGTEFSAWERIEEKTGMIVYFAHHITPGACTNENTNGSCGSISKRSGFQSDYAGELAHVVKILNDRRESVSNSKVRDRYFKNADLCNESAIQSACVIF